MNNNVKNRILNVFLLAVLTLSGIACGKDKGAKVETTKFKFADVKDSATETTLHIEFKETPASFDGLYLLFTGSAFKEIALLGTKVATKAIGPDFKVNLKELSDVKQKLDIEVVVADLKADQKDLKVELKDAKDNVIATATLTVTN